MGLRIWTRKHAMTSSTLLRLTTVTMFLLAAAPLAGRQPPVRERVQSLIASDRPYVLVNQELFDQLGWDLPDKGATVKAIADAAPDGAFDPRALEQLGPAKIG